MTSTGSEVRARYAAASLALSLLSTASEPHRRFDEAELLEIDEQYARLHRQLGTVGVILAGEIARRSAPSLGSSGLAQRSGFRTAEELVKISTGSTGREAAAVVRAGRLVNESAMAGTRDPATGELLEVGELWLRPVAAALRSGDLSAAAAESIGKGLGEPNSAVSADQLQLAAVRLCAEASTIDPDRMFRRARELRNQLDVAGIPIRKEERRATRSVRLIAKQEGGWSVDLGNGSRDVHRGERDLRSRDLAAATRAALRWWA